MLSAPQSPIPTISITDTSFEYSKASRLIHDGDVYTAAVFHEMDALIASLPEEESFRNKHLVPPPIVSPIRPPGLRLNTAALPADKKGLERSRFDELLRNSRNRMLSGSSRKQAIDLRREVGIKVAHAKQEERRATFLARVRAPPSPTAALTPATPPDSPAEFHFSLPSPGLVSPLAMFEAQEVRGQQWVERIDYHKAAREALITPPSPGPPQVSRIGSFKLEDSSLRRSSSGASPLSSSRLMPVGSAGANAHMRPSSGLIVPPRRSSSISPTLPSLNQITARIASSGPTANQSTSRVSGIAPLSGRVNAASSQRLPFPAIMVEGRKAGVAERGPPTIALPPPLRRRSVDLTESVEKQEGSRAERGSRMISTLKRRSSAPAQNPVPRAERPRGGF